MTPSDPFTTNAPPTIANTNRLIPIDTISTVPPPSVPINTCTNGPAATNNALIAVHPNATRLANLFPYFTGIVGIPSFLSPSQSLISIKISRPINPANNVIKSLAVLLKTSHCPPPTLPPADKSEGSKCALADPDAKGVIAIIALTATFFVHILGFKCCVYQYVTSVLPITHKRAGTPGTKVTATNNKAYKRTKKRLAAEKGTKPEASGELVSEEERLRRLGASTPLRAS
mmetsp:Transcript_16146/g.22143  ORF Transcript_16146/g.22143 Transcript_16146/m.22143 type:complete len:230 (-) Transcript_16146:1177-1866(-)